MSQHLTTFFTWDRDMTFMWVIRGKFYNLIIKICVRSESVTFLSFFRSFLVFIREGVELSKEGITRVRESIGFIIFLNRSK